METKIAEWLEAQTSASKRQMAQRVGQAPSTFNRNIETAEVIISVCRAYNLNPVDGLTAAGILTEEEVAEASAKSGIDNLSERDLLMEVIRRVDSGKHDDLTRPVRDDDVSAAFARSKKKDNQRLMDTLG